MCRGHSRKYVNSEVLTRLFVVVAIGWIFSAPDPNRLPAVANELMAIMAAADAKVDAIQHQQPPSDRTNHGARSPKAS
jgi:hypothetical protein